ncbi:MAG: ATP-binding protein [Myxococcales bacterium]
MMSGPDISTLRLLGMILALLQAVALGALGSARGSPAYMRRWWIASCLIASSFVASLAGELGLGPRRLLLLLGSGLSVAGFANAYDGFQRYFHRTRRALDWYVQRLLPVYVLLTLVFSLGSRRSVSVALVGAATIALTLPGVNLLVSERRNGQRRRLSLVTAIAFLGYVLVTLLRMTTYALHEEAVSDPQHWMHLVFASYLVVFFPTLTILLTLLHSRRTQDELNTSLEAQREKAEELDRHFNSSRDLLAVIDEDGRFERVNEEWRRDLSYEPASLLGSSLLDLVHEDDRQATRRMLRGPPRMPVFNFVNRCRGADGKPRFIEWNVQPIESRRHLVGRDITQRRALQDQLQQAQKMEIIGQLAGGVAHDLNNSLAAIVTASDLLAQQLSRGEASPRCVQAISEAALRGKDLTREILVFSRKDELDFKPIDAHQVVRSSVGLLRHSVQRSVRIEDDLEAPRSRVKGDSALLQSAVLNLGINARDAMPDGGSIVVSTSNVAMNQDEIAEHAWHVAPGDFLRIDVTDTGTGMSEELQQRIFDPFFTTKPAGKGTGLGLASVYATAERHHGVVTVHSELGRGSTFSLFLPIATQA